jgi:hypothetical protein
MKKDNRLTHSSGLKIPNSAEYQQGLRASLAARGVLAKLNNTCAPLESSIICTADCIYEFFHSNGYIVLRSEWDTNMVAPALLSYLGWVYAFYGAGDAPLYVGETGRTFRERFSEHDQQPWWQYWERVKVLPCPNQSMRKIFESLIGLAGGYMENKLQPPGGDNVFDDIVLSLLLLGNDGNFLPTFPNQMVYDHAKLLLDLLPPEIGESR